MALELEQDMKGMLPEKDFDRRDFIWSALGASAALALSRSASAQEITTDTEGIAAADVSIPTGTGNLRGYRAMPAAGGPFPVALVAAEIFGLNHYMKDICRRLAKAGYYAIVPDLYTRKADLTKLTSTAGTPASFARRTATTSCSSPPPIRASGTSRTSDARVDRAWSLEHEPRLVPCHSAWATRGSTPRFNRPRSSPAPATVRTKKPTEAPLDSRARLPSSQGTESR